MQRLLKDRDADNYFSHFQILQSQPNCCNVKLMLNCSEISSRAVLLANNDGLPENTAGFSHVHKLEQGTIWAEAEYK